MARYVLDTSLLLQGGEPPKGEWSTTPEAAAEISPGGRAHRKYEYWLAAGLRMVAASSMNLSIVQDMAQRAGNWSRLSAADRSLLALALDLDATLVTDDHTMLDVAARLRLATMTIQSKPITGLLNFQPRCSGCGRWFETMPKGDECPICGSPVKDKVRKP